MQKATNIESHRKE